MRTLGSSSFCTFPVSQLLYPFDQSNSNWFTIIIGSPKILYSLVFIPIWLLKKDAIVGTIVKELHLCPNMCRFTFFKILDHESAPKSSNSVQDWILRVADNIKHEDENWLKIFLAVLMFMCSRKISSVSRSVKVVLLYIETMILVICQCLMK